MPFRLFKSRQQSSPKGNTIKKSEPIDGRQTRRDFHSDKDHDESVVDHMTVGEWLKDEGKGSLNADDSAHHGVLRTTVSPRGATVVDRDDSRTRSLKAEIDKVSEKGVKNAAEVPVAVNAKDEAPVEPMLDLLLGSQDPSSRYFTKKYIRVHASAMSITNEFTTPSSSSSVPVTSNGLMSVPDLDPHAFELFQIWTHTGIVPLRFHQICRSSQPTNGKYVWPACWPLMNAHMLGCVLKIPPFSDRVIDILQEYIGKTVYPDVDTINHIFSADHSRPAVLERFVVDRWIEAAAHDGHEDLNVEDLPPSFVQLMLQTALRRLCSFQPSSKVSGCGYHTHQDTETCYKNRTHPAEVSRQQRLEFARDMSRKDSEQLVTNAASNGVKIVDWEVRRAEAERLSRERTGMTWAGSSRSGDALGVRNRPVEGPAAKELNGEMSSPQVASQKEIESGTSAEPLFGTTQTAGAVDDVFGKPPSRKAPSPPVMELPATLSCTAQHAFVTPIRDVGTGALDMNEISFKACANHRSDVPTPSKCSVASNPDSELRQKLEMALRYERQAKCPGAFPLSRTGSAKSIVQ
tara:strand:- start:325 stop:2049 length:1725 start_codon:yes stop_codon:yes gene_type:complete